MSNHNYCDNQPYNGESPHYESHDKANYIDSVARSSNSGKRISLREYSAGEFAKLNESRDVRSNTVGGKCILTRMTPVPRAQLEPVPRL